MPSNICDCLEGGERKSHRFIIACNFLCISSSSFLPAAMRGKGKRKAALLEASHSALFGALQRRRRP